MSSGITIRRRRGAALMLALVALSVVGALGAALTAMVLGGIKRANVAAERDRLLNVAESGVEVAIARLARGRPLFEESIRVPGGECAVAVVESAGGFVVTSVTATAEGHSRRPVCLRVGLARGGGSPLRVVEWGRTGVK